MQTSSKVSSVKRSGLFASIFGALINSKYEPVGEKGHYFEGNIDRRYNCRKSQRQRRKLARRVGY